jgi:hypothetical protein
MCGGPVEAVTPMLVKRPIPSAAATRLPIERSTRRRLRLDGIVEAHRRIVDQCLVKISTAMATKSSVKYVIE